MATKKWIQEHQEQVRKYRRDYYYRNREKEIARSKKIKKERRKIVLDYIYEIKSKSKCLLCGYDKYISALVFHHKNGKDKLFTISNGKDYSLKKIKEEIKKCEVLCSNCHSALHNKEIPL